MTDLDLTPAPATAAVLDAGVADLVARTTVTAGDGAWIAEVDDEVITAESGPELARALAGYFYATLHARIPTSSASEFVPALQQDHDLEQRLLDATATVHRRQRLAVLEELPGADGVVVALQGLRVYLPGETVLDRAGGFVDAQLPTLASRLSVGFLFYTSRAGGGRGSRPLRLYRHLRDADEAVAAWKRVTTWTEAAEVPLRTKVISQTWGYPRNDALVVYLPSEAWHRADELADVMAGDADATTSVFARRIRPGIGLAWEPQDLDAAAGRTSFGEHRSSAVARGLVDLDDTRSPAARVRRELIKANADPAAVHRNLDSPPLEWWVS